MTLRGVEHNAKGTGISGVAQKQYAKPYAESSKPKPVDDGRAGLIDALSRSESIPEDVLKRIILLLLSPRD